MKRKYFQFWRVIVETGLPAEHRRQFTINRYGALLEAKTWMLSIVFGKRSI